MKSSLEVDGLVVGANMVRHYRARIERLEQAAKAAVEIIDRNLYHQREKVEDASSILREALGERE